MSRSRIQAFILALITATSVAAMDSPKPDPKEPEKDKDKKSSQLEQGRAAIARQDWTTAQGLLREAVVREPRSADAHNLYAFSIRKGASPAMDVVFRHYNEALRLDPAHRGAHEYLGEAYLMSGNVAKAKEHLAQLDRLCAGSCEEFAKLRLAVAQYEQQHAKK
jgi:Tfp pilus assembly protein PilF